jgi:hypothetical protein
VTFTADLDYPSAPGEVTAYKEGMTLPVPAKVVTYAQERKAIRPLPADAPAPKRPRKRSSTSKTAPKPATLPVTIPDPASEPEPVSDEGG